MIHLLNLFLSENTYQRYPILFQQRSPEKIAKLPLIDAIQMIPSMRSLMKGLVSGKISRDSDVMMVSKECSAVQCSASEQADQQIVRPWHVCSLGTNWADIIRMFSVWPRLKRESHVILCGKEAGFHQF